MSTFRTIRYAAVAAAILAAGSVPAAIAAPPAKKKAAPQAPTTYECAKCHMKVSAADAKKDHYKDPMDGGKLVPVKAAKAAPGKAGAMGAMKGM